MALENDEKKRGQYGNSTAYQTGTSQGESSAQSSSAFTEDGFSLSNNNGSSNSKSASSNTASGSSGALSNRSDEQTGDAAGIVAPVFPESYTGRRSYLEETSTENAAFDSKGKNSKSKQAAGSQSKGKSYKEEMSADITAPGSYSKDKGSSSKSSASKQTAAFNSKGKSYKEEMSTDIAAPRSGSVSKGKNYKEEMSTDIAAPVSYDKSIRNQGNNNASGTNVNAGSMMGYLGLIASILSLFILPVLLGATGIILGFVARRRGAEMLGAWAIGIGVVSLILGLFVLPFF